MSDDTTDLTPPDPCLICRHRTPRAGYTCGHCLSRMRRQLDDLPTYYALAAGELTTSTGGTGRGSDTPLGLNLAALDLRHAIDLLDTLGSWCRVFREDFDLPDWIQTRHVDIHDRTGITLVETVAYLQTHLARISESHPAVDEFAAELATLHGKAQAAARAAPRQAWVVSCPRDDPDPQADPDRRCGRPIRVSGSDLGGHVRCRGCGTGWDVTRLLHVVASDRGSSVWLPAEEMSLLSGISERTLQRWARDGKVNRSHGQYELESVRRAALRSA